MVEAVVEARNANDNSLRYWGLSVDKLPSGNWVKDKSMVVAARKQTEPWLVNLDIADGKHTVFFVISQTSPEIGGYDGEIALGGASFTFDGVDNDTINGFDIEVKNGKVMSTSKTGRDIETNEDGSHSWTEPFRKIGGAFQKIPEWVKEKQEIAALVALGVGVAGATSYVLYRKYKGKRF